jgi:hypothetical protein
MRRCVIKTTAANFKREEEQKIGERERERYVRFVILTNQLLKHGRTIKNLNEKTVNDT